MTLFERLTGLSTLESQIIGILYRALIISHCSKIEMPLILKIYAHPIVNVTQRVVMSTRRARIDITLISEYRGPETATSAIADSDFSTNFLRGERASDQRRGRSELNLRAIKATLARRHYQGSIPQMLVSIANSVP